MVVLGLLFRSPGTKSHLDVGVAERRREYYMGEGGHFPRVQAVVSLVSLRSPMVCLSTKGAPNNVLTSLFNAFLSPLLDPLEGLSMLNCGKLGLEGLSRLPALEGDRGAC